MKAAADHVGTVNGSIVAASGSKITPAR